MKENIFYFELDMYQKNEMRYINNYNNSKLSHSEYTLNRINKDKKNKIRSRKNEYKRR